MFQRNYNQISTNLLNARISKIWPNDHCLQVQTQCKKQAVSDKHEL